MLIFGRDMLSERLQKEALLYPFCQDFAVPNVIIHMAEQIANDANVKHKTHDVVNIIVKYCTTCNFQHNQAFAESSFDFTVAEVEHRPPTLSNTRFIDGDPQTITSYLRLNVVDKLEECIEPYQTPDTLWNMQLEGTQTYLCCPGLPKLQLRSACGR